MELFVSCYSCIPCKTITAPGFKFNLCASPWRCSYI